MQNEYWVARGEAIRGPYPESRIRGALRSGKLLPTDVVSVDSPSGPWVPLPSLFPDNLNCQGDAPALKGVVEGLPPLPPIATSDGPPRRDAATLYTGDLPAIGSCSLPGSSKPSPTAPAAHFSPDTSAPLETLPTCTKELKASNQFWPDILKAAWTADAAPRLPDLLRPLASLNPKTGGAIIAGSLIALTILTWSATGRSGRSPWADTRGGAPYINDAPSGGGWDEFVGRVQDRLQRDLSEANRRDAGRVHHSWAIQSNARTGPRSAVLRAVDTATFASGDWSTTEWHLNYEHNGKSWQVVSGSQHQRKSNGYTESKVLSDLGRWKNVWAQGLFGDGYPFVSR